MHEDITFWYTWGILFSLIAYKISESIYLKYTTGSFVRDMTEKPNYNILYYIDIESAGF